MPAPPFRRIAIRFAAVVILTLATVGADSASLAQSASASTLKAAYVVNFVKFTKWNDLKTGAPIRLCVLADGPLTEAILRATRDASVAGHVIEVLPIDRRADIKACEALFVSDADVRVIDTLLAEARTRRLLTVSDRHAATNPGPIIELFTDGDRLKFAIDIDGMTASGVKISSRLLSLAQITHASATR